MCYHAGRHFQCIAAQAMTQRLTVGAWAELVSTMCVQCFLESRN